jgi:hypothetical protein
MISLPIDWQDTTPRVSYGTDRYRLAGLGYSVVLDGVTYRIVGFRTDNKAVVDCNTHVVALWHETFTGGVIFATHAVLKKETDR